MNIQIPFELLGNYESVALNTDDTFYQLTVLHRNNRFDLQFK